MIIRKNFKRDEVLLKVKNRLEASNLELRLRLMQHEVERRKDRLKREMGQIIECQHHCKRSSGDSVGIYWDLVLNSHFRFSPAQENTGLPNNYRTGNDANVKDQDPDSGTNAHWKHLQNDTCNVPKAKITAVKQAKTTSNLTVPITKMRKPKEGTNSVHSLKTANVTQTLLNNGQRKSFQEETKTSHDDDKERTGPRTLTGKNNPNQESNPCPTSNSADGNTKTISNKLKLPKIVSFPSSSPPPETKKTSISDDKNDAESSETKNKQPWLSVLNITSKESTKRSLCESDTTNKALITPTQIIEQSEVCKSSKLPAINAPSKSIPNILDRSRKKTRSQNDREMMDIIARIASELKLESPSLFGKLVLTDGAPGKIKHSGPVGKTNLDPSGTNDRSGPPNRLMQKGRFFPEHMSYSDMSDDSKSQSSTTDDSPYILYKGRKLRNYVKPQDRFRVDQLTRTWKKQQLYLKLLENRPNDLTKCSLRWDPALGDSDSLQLSQPAKKKALERMVEENMSRPVLSRPENGHTELSNRVKVFMDSLGHNSDGFFL